MTPINRQPSDRRDALAASHEAALLLYSAPTLRA